jgi:hypothetical protein
MSLDQTVAVEKNDETAALAYQESLRATEALTGWYEALDGKAVAVFSVSSLIVGLAPKVAVARGIPWAVALVAWGISAGACFWALLPKDFRFDPKPKVLMNEAWLRLDPVAFRRFRLEDVAVTYRVNSEAYKLKSKILMVAIGATVIEVISLAVALFRGTC